jgi:hypothetical protein
MTPTEMMLANTRNVAAFQPAPYLNKLAANNPIAPPKPMDTNGAMLPPGAIQQPQAQPTFGGTTKPLQLFAPINKAAPSMPSVTYNPPPPPITRPPNAPTVPPPPGPTPPPTAGLQFGGSQLPFQLAPTDLSGPNDGTWKDQYRRQGVDAANAGLPPNYSGIDRRTGYQYLNGTLFAPEGKTQSGDNSVMGQAFQNQLQAYGLMPLVNQFSNLDFSKLGTVNPLGRTGGPILGGAAPAPAPEGAPPPDVGGGNPIARPPGGPIIPGGGGGGFAPGGGLNQPGRTDLPYGGGSPPPPGSWQDLLTQLFPGDLAGNETRNTSRSGLDPRLDSTFNYLMGQALQRYADPNGQHYYEGNTVAQLTPDELQAQALMRQQAGDTSMGDASGDYLKTLLSRAQNPSSDPTVQAAIDAMAKDATQSMTDPGGVLANIRSAGIQNGNLGSSRQGIAEGLAAARLQDTIAKNSAAMRMDARDKNLSAANAVLTQMPQIEAQKLMPSQLLSTVGQQNRSQDQAQITDALTRWAYNTFEPDRRLQNVYGLLNATPLGGYNTGDSFLGNDLLARMGSPSTAQNIVGGLTGGAALLTFLQNLGIFNS